MEYRNALILILIFIAVSCFAKNIAYLDNTKEFIGVVVSTSPAKEGGRIDINFGNKKIYGANPDKIKIIESELKVLEKSDITFKLTDDLTSFVKIETKYEIIKATVSKIDDIKELKIK